MAKYNDIYTPTNNESYEFWYCKVLNNSWAFDESAIRFFGRPANSMEKRTYNLQKGVINDNVSLYIYSSNLPDEIKPNDKVRYLGKIWTVQSVGYYFDITRFIDASIFDEEYIRTRCAKGITII